MEPGSLAGPPSMSPALTPRNSAILARHWSASVFRPTRTRVETWCAAMTAHAITVLPVPGGATSTSQIMGTNVVPDLQRIARRHRWAGPLAQPAELTPATDTNKCGHGPCWRGVLGPEYGRSARECGWPVPVGAGHPRSAVNPHETLTSSKKVYVGSTA